MQAQSKYKEIEDLRREEDCRKQSIIEAKRKLADAERDLQNLPAYEPPKEEIVSHIYWLFCYYFFAISQVAWYCIKWL